MSILETDKQGRRLAWLSTDAVIALAVALVSFVLYLRTLAPDVVDADGGEFQFATWNFSFVHPTGYPLYLIFGGLFQHLVPIGNPAYRLNLFTAITAALAVAMVYLVANQLTRHRGASIVAAASFAVTRAFWYDAGAAETYDLNAFFVALLICIALRWQSEPTARKLATFCFAYGLAFTHHRSIILWMPAFLLFFAIIIFQWRSKFPVPNFQSQFLLLAFSFLLPLSLYLYIPLRAPVSPYAVLPIVPGRDIVLYDNSPIGFANYILGRVFQYELGWDTLSVARLATVPQLILDQFGVLGFVLGSIGFAAMIWRKEWAQLALLCAGFAMAILFASVYHIGDIFHYYIPAYLVWAIWVGLCIAELLTAIRNLQFSIRALCFLVCAILLLVPQFVANLQFADRSQETMAREQWSRILSVSPPQNAILISNDRDEMMPLWYIQYVENTRRDVLGLFPLITPAPQYANIARLTDSVLDVGRPTYFIKPMPGIEIKYRVVTAEPLVRVLGRTVDAPPQLASDVTLDGRVRVLGYDAMREPNGLRVTIYWQPRAKLDRDYTTFVHVLDARGSKIAQSNDHQVGGEFYPTSMWSIGETLRDEHLIALPPDVALGSYRLLVGMYHQPEMETLGEPAEIGIIEFK